MNRTHRHKGRMLALAATCLLGAAGLYAGHAQAASAIVCDTAASADPRSCTAAHYTRHLAPTDLVRAGNGWADASPVPAIPFALKAYSTVGVAETIDACASPDVADGTPIPFPWSAGADACKSWAVVPAATFSTADGVLAVLTVSWVLPLASIDDTPLVGDSALTGIQLFVSTSPIPDDSTVAPTATFSGDMMQATYNGTVPNGATLYARVKAVNRGGASAFSAQASKLIDVPISPPGVPTDVSIQFRIVPKQ